MKQAANKIRWLAENPFFIVIAGITSILAFLWLLYDKANTADNSHEIPSVFHSPTLIISLFILSVGYIYSIRVRVENIALRKISEKFYDINNIYRDTLRRMFAGDTPNTNPLDLLTEEERALRSVCQRIENIFSRVISRDCLVTIKLVTNENGINYASTYVRSLENCERDLPKPAKYKIDPVSNSAFFKAIQPRPDGKPPHFFSGNLEKEEKDGNYSNERQHFARFYNSAIVVPIIATTGGLGGDEAQQDLVGFLTVDTLSKYRLNDGFHLYMMSALASQMYNFLSLMRGKYTVSLGE